MQSTASKPCLTQFDAALTNVRDLRQQRADAPSRGALVSDFLRGQSSAAQYLESIAATAAHYNPFNLLVYDGQTLLGFQSQGARIVAMQPGIAAVSNAGFDTPWPKLLALKSGLQDWVMQQTRPQAPGNEALFAMLAHNERIAPFRWSADINRILGISAMRLAVNFRHVRTSPFSAF